MPGRPTLHGELLLAGRRALPLAAAPGDKNWASEAANYDHGTNACAPGKVCGHYTQIVWRNTTQVGCATRECDKNSPFQGFTRWQFWVCNYAPPGNYSGQRPY